MEDRDLLIEGLIKEGVEPTEEAIYELDAAIEELASVLCDYVLWKTKQKGFSKLDIRGVFDDESGQS